MTIDSLLLNLIWVLPILTVLLCLPVPRANRNAVQLIHAGSALLNLVIAAYLTVRVYSLSMAAGVPTGNQPTLHFLTDLSWFRFLNIHFITGADALSILMILMTSIIMFTGILSSWNPQKQGKEFFALAQILGASVYGVFMSFDLVLFMLFYEVEALSMYLMIANWGSGRKDYSGKKLVLTLAFGSALELIGVIGVYFQADIHSWDISRLAQIRLPESFQMWAFPLLFIGFAVSSSLFPFHNWSPDGHSAAPTAVSMLAAGVMMKMGAYGCIRIAMYLLPEGARFWLPYILYLVIFNVVLAAFIAIRQKDLKYIIAYSSISHLGLIILGLCAMTSLSIKGAALQMISHGFLTGLFFATIGMIYSRTHTRMVHEMGGLMKSIPFIGVGFVIAGFAGLGLPGLSGFVAEATIFMGSFQNPSPWVRVVTVLSILSITTTAVYVLQATNRLLHGPLPEKFQHLSAPTWPERITVILLVASLVGMGIFPSWISAFLDTSIQPIFVNFTR